MSHDSANANAREVAVVGAGPAGFYAAAQLLSGKAIEGDVRVDLFDRLPTPYGLVSFGFHSRDVEEKTQVQIGERPDRAELRQEVAVVRVSQDRSASRIEVGVQGE